MHLKDPLGQGIYQSAAGHADVRLNGKVSLIRNSDSRVMEIQLISSRTVDSVLCRRFEASMIATNCEDKISIRAVATISPCCN